MKKCYTYHTIQTNSWSPQAQAFWASGNIGSTDANCFMCFFMYICELLCTIYTGATAWAVVPVFF
ncbi:MAG TPA: hypothetical protein PLK40_07845 [Bacteroidaceae bacterium]|nr:hypothetical protein [Bacteroidaceae bacterium]